VHGRVGASPLDETKHRVLFTHDVVWSDGVLDGFSDPNKAYEHDLKVYGNGGIVGTRPLCFSLPWTGWNDVFYAYREDGVLWSTNMPDDAWPYFGIHMIIDAGGFPRGRIQLPTATPDGLGYYTHEFQIIADA
jgi:hypothetical protein